MKKLIFILVLLVCSVFVTNAQTTCPTGMVCLTQAQASAILKENDEAKGLKAENAALKDENKIVKESYEAVKAEVTKVQIEFARVSGENTVLKEDRVADRATIAVLVQYSRAKKFGIINF